MLTINELQERANVIADRFEITRPTVIRLTEQSHKAFRLGYASYFQNVLAISYERPLEREWKTGKVLSVTARPDEELMETLYHEMAHFVAFKFGDFKHGRIWKKYSRMFGAYPRARVGDIAAEEAKNKRISDAKTIRARNRKAHPTHSDPYQHLDCHICMRELMGN